jgi:hypothetical protein
MKLPRLGQWLAVHGLQQKRNGGPNTAARFGWEPLSKIDCYRIAAETILKGH